MTGWVGTDTNGYNFAPELLSATGEGKWVTYVFANPESGDFGPGHTGEFELKNVWVVRHDGLLFASGWYINADEFAQQLVSVAVEKFRSGGLEGTMEYFANPGSALAGLETAVAYYNSAETVDGRWWAFIADESGRFVGHSDPAMIGREVRELFGTELPEATGEGGWVTGDSVRIWVAESAAGTCSAPAGTAARWARKAESPMAGGIIEHYGNEQWPVPAEVQPEGQASRASNERVTQVTGEQGNERGRNR